MRVDDARPSIAWRGVVGMVVYLLLMSASLFLAAGTISWPIGWIYIGLLFGVTALSRIFAWRKHPDLLVERSRFAEVEGVASWDRPIVLYIGVIGPVLMTAIAGLNYRYEWIPEVAAWLQIAGLLVITIGYALATWAVAANPFFSAVVRIQHDRGQVVVANGPYRWIRHPGYAGGTWSTLASPVMLGSFWALIPAISICIVLAARTKLEDELLIAELDGYGDYALQTRYRLVPGLW